MDAGVRERAYELRGTLATVLPLFGVDAAGVRLIGWADGDCVKMRGLGCCCWMGMRQSSPGQRPRLWGRVSQRAKAVVLVDVVALVALDLATPPTWSDPGGPALQLPLARRVNYRRGGNDLRDNATGTSDGYSPVSKGGHYDVYDGGIAFDDVIEWEVELLRRHARIQSSGPPTPSAQEQSPTLNGE